MSTELTWDTPGRTWDNPLLTWDGNAPEDNPNQGPIMSTGNLIAKTVTPADKAAFLAKVAELAGLAATYSSNVPVDDKKNYAIIGQKRAGMDEVFTRSMTDNPGLVPSFVVMADLTQDRGFRVDVKDMTAPLQTLIEGLQDSDLLASNDCFLHYTAYYNNVKMAALRNVPGADTELAKLQVFFPTGRRQPAAPTP